MVATPTMLFTATVTILAVILYVVTAARVGRLREKHNIVAPAITGHRDFERAYRVQMNTLESLPVFFPVLWLAAIYFRMIGYLVPAIGLVWIVGRIVYMQAYMTDPASRSLGFGIAAFSQVVLLALAVAGIIMTWTVVG
ncbi:MAG: MAPEG family protein [Rhizomicrobium sp.]